ncbi:hypothetical protein SKAU_G00146320 [Synaphobranchus kaupii]|uniref:Uncharacterized protein n=1 Tax=Synaphobranchus kaupii TaxID=118154 RepID=A0A9Q1FT61_SYNKA|nr:hypothetical protein SKAU_G00146320 [Synaphobranchus kaupii]
MFYKSSQQDFQTGIFNLKYYQVISFQKLGAVAFNLSRTHCFDFSSGKNHGAETQRVVLGGADGAARPSVTSTVFPTRRSRRTVISSVLRTVVVQTYCHAVPHTVAYRTGWRGPSHRIQRLIGPFLPTLPSCRTRNLAHVFGGSPRRHVEHFAGEEDSVSATSVAEYFMSCDSQTKRKAPRGEQENQAQRRGSPPPPPPSSPRGCPCNKHCPSR